nr:hypothetical protein [Tanacetum cinerariifolium]
TPLRVVIAFKSLLGLAMVLLGRVLEIKVEALLEFTNLAKNPPLKHLLFEEPELETVLIVPLIELNILIVWNGRKTRGSNLI